MSVLFTDIMTVYNNYRDRDTGAESWNRSVIRGVQWTHNRRELSTRGGVQTETKVESITVDFQRNYGNKPYLPPQEYALLSTEESKKYWTLDSRGGTDMVVQGIVELEIGKEYTLSELKKDFQYAAVVGTVSDNRNRPRLKTIKLTGK